MVLFPSSMKTILSAQKRSNSVIMTTLLPLLQASLRLKDLLFFPMLTDYIPMIRGFVLMQRSLNTSKKSLLNLRQRLKVREALLGQVACIQNFAQKRRHSTTVLPSILSTVEKRASSVHFSKANILVPFSNQKRKNFLHEKDGLLTAVVQKGTLLLMMAQWRLSSRAVKVSSLQVLSWLKVNSISVIQCIVLMQRGTALQKVLRIIPSLKSKGLKA